MLAGLLALCCATGAAAAADEMMLTGSGDRLWLVRIDRQEEPSFDVLTYQAGHDWQWVARNLTGQPIIIAAGGAQLHVLTGPETSYFSILPGENRTFVRDLPNELTQGDAVPLSACTAHNFAGVDGWSLLVALPHYSNPTLTVQPDQRPPQAAEGASPVDADQPAPAQMPAPAKRQATLTVLQYGGGEWRTLTELPDVQIGNDNRMLSTVVGDMLYLLTGGTEGNNKLWAWAGDGHQWITVVLSDEAATGEVLSMFPAGDRLMMLVALQAQQDRPLSLTILSSGPTDGLASSQPITINGQPFSPPRAPLAAPLVAPVELHRVGMLWQEGQTVRFTLCDIMHGEADPPIDLAVLAQGPPDTSGQKVLNYFLIVLVLATFTIVILVRPQIPPGPIILPPTCRPAPLGKRAMACLVDLMSISIVVSLILPTPEPPMDLIGNPSEFFSVYSEMLMTRQAAYSVIATLCTYMVYGIVMEARFAATVGKMLFRIRVAAGDGQRPGLREVVLRNVVKMLELFPMLWLLLLVPLLNPARQRLGDILARTVVLERSEPIPPPQVAEGETDADPHDEQFRQPPGNEPDQH